MSLHHLANMTTRAVVSTQDMNTQTKKFYLVDIFLQYKFISDAFSFLPSLHRLPQCVSKWLVEGALVRGARRELVPAEGPRGPAATGHCGAPQRCRGGARWPWPQTPLLFLHPAGRQWTSIFRGKYFVVLRCHFEMPEGINVRQLGLLFFFSCLCACPSGQLLRGSRPLAGCVVCRDRQHHPPWRVALRLHWCGYTDWHTARCQTLLPVSHFLHYVFLCCCMHSSGVLCLFICLLIFPEMAASLPPCFFLSDGPRPLLFLPAVLRQTPEHMMRSMKALRWGIISDLPKMAEMTFFSFCS